MGNIAGALIQYQNSKQNIVISNLTDTKWYSLLLLNSIRLELNLTIFLPEILSSYNFVQMKGGGGGGQPTLSKIHEIYTVCSEKTSPIFGVKGYRVHA